MELEDKLKRMYHAVNGEIGQGFRLRLHCQEEYDEQGYHDNPTAWLVLLKGNDEVCRYSREELLFDYLTKDWTHE